MMYNEINKSQQQYLSLLKRYKALFSDYNLRSYQIASFLDEIKIFWLKRLNIIEYEIEDMTHNTKCFVLSGAIYLNIADHENYYFISLGDTHIIKDPFLKLDVFFRIDESKIDWADTKNYFLRAYEDTLLVLEKYPNLFYVLPIHEMAWKSNDTFLEILNSFFWKFITSVFNKDISNEQEFSQHYSTFDAIEKDLTPSLLSNLIFTDNSDSQKSLKDRIQNYAKNQFNFSLLMEHKTEAQIFITMLYSQISQILDILLTCSSMNIFPYIRFEVTFRYLILIMETFIRDDSTKEMIEKTIIFYIFHNIANEEVFAEVDFIKYAEKAREIKLLDIIIKRLREEEIDVISNGVKELTNIIREEFSKLLSMFKDYEASS